MQIPEVTKKQNCGVLGAGVRVEVNAGTDPERHLLLATRPLKESEVRFDSFAMNTRAKIEKAICD